MDKSREQFDQWLKQQGLKPVAWIKDEYWKVWKASRAAVEIELPSELSLKKFACSDCIGAVLEAVENHVLAAGIKVKGE
ncbi:hypothetical protein SM080_000709 [Cronobacter sakazakii]|nr:hypothetical protein [Cronobacter sakazakii]EGT4452606.1 hypothetical protein [Cronobacter sakazakii]ELY2894563.1 hypothetical protein [Cronobacter sakazakii]ELY4758242.1 hypothetical protein [Cronobacter sakazakii]